MKQALTLVLIIALLCPMALAERAEPEHQATLYADFSCGGDGVIEQYELGYDGELTVQILADGLSALTGLDFTIDGETDGADGYAIDWSADSTLVAGLDDREQNEHFHFYDVDSLSWFMMDSLCRTVRENLKAENVYFTMNGGEMLELPDMADGFKLLEDDPYQGSAAYAPGDEASASGLQLAETYRLPDLVEQGTDVGELGWTKRYMTEDGIIAVENSVRLEDDPAEYGGIEEMLKALVMSGEGDDMPHNPRVFEDADFSAAFSYPSYLVSFRTGANEDLREHLALAVTTDDGVLIYAFSVSADWFDDLRDELYKVLSGLELVEK